MKKDGENPVKNEEVLIKLPFEEQTWRTLCNIFTFSYFASQEVDDSVECKTVESKPDNNNIEELAIQIDTKSRHPSSEKSSEDESEGNSEVTAKSII